MVPKALVAAFAVVSLGVIVLRRTRPDLPRAYRAPLYPLLPAASVLFCLYLIWGLPWVTHIMFAAWLGAVAPSMADDAVGHLALVHAHPEWMVRAFAEDIDGEDRAQLTRSQATEPLGALMLWRRAVDAELAVGNP